MSDLISPRRLLPLAVASVVLAQGCGEGGGGGGGRFVPNDVKVEKIDGMSPSEAYHKNDRRRR